MKNKPQWQARIEGMKRSQFSIEHPLNKINLGYNQAIDDLIPIIEEEMQKQREEVIDECTALSKTSIVDQKYAGYIFDELQALKQKNHD